MTKAEATLAVAAALHLGFQLTVTALVYPALARVSSGDWPEAHQRHARVITPVVIFVYGALALALAAAWAWAPGWPTAVASAGAALACGTTALVAAPAHGRLGRGHDVPTLQMLLRADRARAAGSVVCLAGALLPVSG